MTRQNAPSLQHHVSLRPFNTLAVAASAASYVEIDSIPALQSVLADHPQPLLVLGGGSNLVLTGDFDGLVIHNRLRGIEVLDESPSAVHLRVGAGEVWDELVRETVANGWFGLENLSWIPGSVGAAPIQNIGAYGVELKDHLIAVHTVRIEDQQLSCFSREDCQFGYRESVFKQGEKGRHVITAIELRLPKQPDLKLDYGEIRASAQRWGYDDATLTPAQVRDIIIRIRQEKLPDPAQAPNVGSFFKNPVVSQAAFQRIKQLEPGVVAYPQADGRVKLAAGWLIDRLGWKGRSLGSARVHERQALVLVNEGQASQDVLKLAEAIQAAVQAHFGVRLEVEPNIV